MRARGTAAVVAMAAAMLLTGCDGGGEASTTSGAGSEARAWAESFPCPTSIGDLEDLAGVPRGVGSVDETGAVMLIDRPTPPPLARSATPRPGTDTSITPPGPVTAVVRCDTTATMLSGTPVQKTVMLDEQPLSWFSDGDHWPSKHRGEQAMAPHAAIVALHYASGPDVVVTRALVETRSSGLVLRSDNGVLQCDVSGMSGDEIGSKVTTTCTPKSGASFVAPARPPVAGAPSVDCPDREAVTTAGASPSPADSPRPGTDATLVPRDDITVVVWCSNASNRLEMWGAAAQNWVAPTGTPVPRDENGGHCLAFGPPCTLNVTRTWIGYASGPPVEKVWVEVPGQYGDSGWMRRASGLDGGSTNGVIACRYLESVNTRPETFAGCLPLARATAGEVPTVSASPSASAPTEPNPSP